MDKTKNYYSSRSLKNRRRKLYIKPSFKQEVKTLAEEIRKSYLQYRSNTTTYDEYKVNGDRISENSQAK